jgi:hypothetical protein
VRPVALQEAGEPVRGALLKLIELMTQFLTRNQIALSNQFLEHNAIIHPLIDGVDSTLLELLSDEIGEDEFVEIATQLAVQTFAARQLPAESTENLRSVFALRARRLIALRTAGKIAWARETGAKVRLIESVEQTLLPMRANWQVDVDPLADELRDAILQWAWTDSELRNDVKECFRLAEDDDVETVRDKFSEIVRLWMGGMRFREIAAHIKLPIDDLLAIHTRAITFSLQMLVEQGISLLAKRLEADGINISEGVQHFPEHLRFGVHNGAARILAATGVRHRSACVQLGTALHNSHFVGNQAETRIAAANSLRQFAEQWRTILGQLVYQNSLTDLSG